VEVVKQDLSGERPFWRHSTQRGAFFSCFLVRLMLYTVVIASLVLLQFPQFMAEKKVRSMKKVPQSVKVSLVAPVKPKPKMKPKPKPKPKKIIKPKPKPKPKKIIKPKPQAKIEEPKREPVDINKTVPKKVQIQEREPIVERAVSIEEPFVAQSFSMEEENKTENYKAYIEDTIRSEKKYPTKARRMRHQGSVKVRFVIDEHGKIKKSEIVHSSGFNTLDKATLSLFKRIDSFDAPPEILETPYEFTIPLVYKLN